MSGNPQMNRGVVKQVLSGDTVIVRGQPKGGPPPERTICLSNITAPKLARRANPNVESSHETKDEPYAWEAREYLRTRLIGRDVLFTVEYTAPGSGREYGAVYIKKSTGELENMTEGLISAGLVDVRRGGISPTSESQQRLVELEEAAKAARQGRWAEGDSTQHVRDVRWTLEDNVRNFVDSLHQKKQTALVEQVRDACTIRAFLLPSFQYVTVMLSGIKAPMFKMSPENTQVAEPLAGEARFFVESRILQREVEVVLEGVPGSQNQNIIGSVTHPKGGNIAELLLRAGFARCVDWSMGMVTQGADKLRAAEKAAKDARLRIWKDYVPPTTTTVAIAEKNFSGKVAEVINGDGLILKTADGSSKKIFLSSVRPPRMSDAQPAEDKEEGKPVREAARKARARPLYDVPYLFEAREFLRKKLIGKKVNVEVDYIQPASAEYQEKVCCTVTSSGINVGEALVGKGLATVVRYRIDDEQRSSHYDELLAAEGRAKKKGAGLHSRKDVPIHRVADIAGDVPKAKQFLPFLQRAGRSEAVVEYVSSGSRFRLFIPRETCLLTFLLSGIDCPRASRPGGAQQGVVPADAYGEEALAFCKDMCMQREVEVEVQSLDKGGNFIGWLFVDGVNVSVSLVEEGLAKVHVSAEKTSFYGALVAAEKRAKEKELNIWKGWVEPAEAAAEKEEDTQTERSPSYREVVVTEVRPELHFFAQSVENGPKLEQLMNDLNTEMQNNPPLPGAYTPKKGELCAAKFSDGAWYRAKVEAVKGSQVTVFYVDYGNSDTCSLGELAALPQSFQAMPPQAREYALALAALPPDEESKEDAQAAFRDTVLNRTVKINVEYRGTGFDYVSVEELSEKEDVGRSLLEEGFIVLDARREKRLQKLVKEYSEAQAKAKRERVNIWRYGDFTEDDAREFGYKR